MAEVFDKAIVEKKNVLNEIRSNNMTLQELRFFSIYLSKINARKVETRVVRFPLSDFQKIMEIKPDLNIAHFKLTVHRILQQIVDIPNENGYGFTSFQLFKEFSVTKDEEDGEWYVEIDAHDKALPLMFDFKKNYFSYELWNALRLKSSNQLRMYEILKQYEKIGRREIKVTDLRQLLGILPTEYPRFERFRVRVLDTCQQALLENTDIKFTYECGKKGRAGKWLTIIFNISKNEDYVDQLSLAEFINTQTEVESEQDEELIEVESKDRREEINAGFGDEIYNEFTDAQLEELKELAWNKITADLPELIERHISTVNDRETARQAAITLYIREKIFLANAKGSRVKTRYSFLKQAIINNYQ